VLNGRLLLQLHAHLPYVRHPEEPVFLEECWLFEAITETYIPLLERFERFHREGTTVACSMTWSPSLCEMLADPLLRGRYRRHVGRLLELAEQEVGAKAGSPFAEAARMYRDHFRFCLAQLDRWNDDLLAWVRTLADAGAIEPITCAATHAFLPLVSEDRCRRAQIAAGVANFRKHFGRDPAGIWLPECGYRPGFEHLLAESGLRFFFVDAHALYYGEPRPRSGVYAPVYCDNGVAAFARDPESSESVWSARTGYPSHPLYREFYRDLGFDGDYGYVRAFLHPDGIRRDLGLKYHRITGDVELHEKLPYEPTPAFARATADAGDFVFNRSKQCQHLHRVLGELPLVVAPYDAELFGHWWYEGPQFLESVFATVDRHSDLRCVAPSCYLDEHPVHQIQSPAASSWGESGYHRVWLNPANDWIYRHLHEAERRMLETVDREPGGEPWRERALAQMARELLLAQSSDWPFILTTGAAAPYAQRRLRDHLNRFHGLYEQLARDRVDPRAVETIEWHDPIFQEIDWRIYR